MADTKVQILQHATVIVNAERHAWNGGNVAHDGAHADWNQQKRFVVFLDRQENEHDPDKDHDQVFPCYGHESGRA